MRFSDPPLKELTRAACWMWLLALTMAVTPAVAMATTPDDAGQAITEDLERGLRHADQIAELERSIADLWTAIGQLQEDLRNQSSSPQVEPQPAGPFDLSGVPTTLKAGDTITVPTTQTGDVWAHWWTTDYRLASLIRATLPVVDGAVTLTVPDPGSAGQRILQLETPDGAAKVKTEPITIEAADAPTSSGGAGYDRLTLPSSMDASIPRATWADVPAGSRPPSPDAIAEVIAPTDPKLREKLLAATPGKWRVVRGAGAMPNAWSFAGWVRVECDWRPAKVNDQVQNFAIGKSDDDRLWFAGCDVISSGVNTFLYGAEYLYADGVIFRGFNHTITDPDYNGGDRRLLGGIINTQIETREDAFQYVTIDAANVAITGAGGAGHPDFGQWNHVKGLRWKHVWAGSPDKPVEMMGLRALSIEDSVFEDVRHYRNNKNHNSIDFNTTKGVVFRGCVWTGPVVVRDGSKVEVLP